MSGVRPLLTAALLALLTRTAGGGELSDLPSPGESMSPGVGAPDDAWATIAPQAPAEEKPLRRASARPAAVARGEAAAPTTGAASWTRTVASLAAVVGLIVLLAWGYRAVSGGGLVLARPRQPGLIEVLSRAALAPRQSVCLLRVGPRLLLVGLSGDRLTALDAFVDADLAARLAGEAASARRDSRVAEFRRALDHEAGQYGESDSAAEAGAPDERLLGQVKQALAQARQRVRAAGA